MTKKSTKIFFYSFLSLVLLLVLLAGYLQSGAFRANLRSALYELAKENTNATFYIGDISGSIVTGFSIDSVLIYIDNAPFVESGRISVKYDLFDLFRNRVTIDSITVQNPKVFLRRRTDGSWNVDHFALSDSVSDSTPLSWRINAKKIRVQNASFQLIDSLGDYQSLMVIDGRKSINYSNMFFDNINLEAKGEYSSEKLAAEITRLSLRSPREEFQLIALALMFYQSKDTSKISNLTLATPDSRLQCNAQVTGVDIFSLSDMKEFENAPTTLNVGRSTIAMKDMHTFLPVLYFLKGKLTISGDFQGNFAQLNVRRLDAAFAKTNLQLSGTISNLHQPEEIRLNIISKQSTIHPPDISALLPYFGIPKFTQLGMLSLDFQFVGKPLDFMVISKVTSAAGTISVDGELLITEDNLHYKGLLAGNNVNLEKIFETPELASRLNTRAFFEGSGTSIEQLNSEFRIELDTSYFRGIDVSSATVELKAKEQTVDAEFTIQSTQGNVWGTTLVDFRRSEPAYMLSTRVRNLNLAQIMDDPHYTSRLSFDLNRNARSFELLSGISNTSITMLPSSFRDQEIDSSNVSVRVDVDSMNNRRIIVRSPIADAELKGQFTFSGFVNTLQRGVGQILRLYAYQRQVVDSSFSVSDSAEKSDGSDTTLQRIDYQITLKNLQPIGIFFRLPMFDAQGTLSGSLVGDREKTEFDGDLQLQKAIFVQDSTIIQARQTSFRYNFKDIETMRKDHPLPMNIVLDLVGFEVGINRTILRYPKVNIRYDGDSGSYALYSDVDTAISIGIEGKVTTTAEAEKLHLSTFIVNYQGFEINNVHPFNARLSQKGIEIDSALFSRRSQTMLLNGLYSFHGMIDATITINNFEMADLYSFSTDQQFRTAAMEFGGTVDAHATVTGLIDDPAFVIDVTGNDLSYQRSPFGTLRGSLRYYNKSAHVSWEVKSGNEPDIELNGVIPIDLRFTPVVDRTDLPGLQVEMKTANLKMSALDPFIPEIAGMTGKIRSEIQFTGSLKNPLINGIARLDSGNFVLEMNGIPYRAQGTILFNDSRVSFSDFSIMNYTEDYFSGRMNVGGNIVLSGFAPEEYHLNAKGELLVLQERSRTPGSSFFGNVIASTGNDSIHFYGNFQRSRITGIVLIRQASLTFPPTQQASAYSSSIYNVVEFIDDTSKQIVDTVMIESLFDFAQRAITSHRTNERTFLDGFGYDLIIQTSGTVRINMIFNANAGAYEELYAELNGKLTMVKDESGVQLIGTIKVGNESKYTFYKTFNASGSLTFVGDPQNPQLNILATYEGAHCVGTNPTTSDCVREERVVVTLNITGTRNIPLIKLGLKTIDQSGKEIERTGDVENDAISFLLTSSAGVPGKFRDELTAQDRDRISNQLATTIGGTYINSLLSSYVMDFVQRNSIPFVKKFEVRQVGADPDIRIGAEVLDAYVNVGGKVFTNVNNANISVEIPLGDKQKRNFMLEVEKKTENFDYSIESRTILGARIFYRFTF